MSVTTFEARLVCKDLHQDLRQATVPETTKWSAESLFPLGLPPKASKREAEELERVVHRDSGEPSGVGGRKDPEGEGCVFVRVRAIRTWN